MSKADARKELQRMLVTLKHSLKEVTDFADEHQLEFDFLEMKYILKGGAYDRYAKTGVFVSESEWQSSSWGCSDSEAYERFEAWERKQFKDEDEDDE